MDGSVAPPDAGAFAGGGVIVAAAGTDGGTGADVAAGGVGATEGGCAIGTTGRISTGEAPPDSPRLFATADIEKFLISSLSVVSLATSSKLTSVK